MHTTSFSLHRLTPFLYSRLTLFGKKKLQCYEANATHPGLWYRYGITPDFIDEVAEAIRRYKTANPSHLVVSYLHVGPNFQWVPSPERTHFLRNLSEAGADLVWGTSSHHVQQFEVYKGVPIIYGLGDFLFRHVVGVQDWCPVYARPCADYRPDLSLLYVFDVTVEGERPHVNLANISAVPTRHTDNATSVVMDESDLMWLEKTFARVSPGAKLIRNGDRFHVDVQDVMTAV